ncbi:MAG TPA: hypothetical protein VHX14_09300 [Thermoanaerobaculia bacterium]|jgi:hypothetical protein|nr:hypothetical protein [Thermoanaerobaculia bacterium]
MRNLSYVTVVILCPLFGVWPVTAATPDVSEAIPATIVLQGAQAPAWVDGSTAVTHAGIVNGDVLPDHGAGVAAILALPQSNGCASVGPIVQERPFTRQRGSFEDLITLSRSIVLARITGKAYGFWAGIPGQLLQVTPQRVFGNRLTRMYYYYFVPVGTFHVGSTTICKTDSRFAAPGETGSEVALFVDQPADREDKLFILEPEDVIGINRDSSLRLPATLAHSANTHMWAKSNLIDKVKTLRREVTR